MAKTEQQIAEAVKADIRAQHAATIAECDALVGKTLDGADVGAITVAAREGCSLRIVWGPTGADRDIIGIAELRQMLTDGSLRVRQA